MKVNLKHKIETKSQPTERKHNGETIFIKALDIVDYENIDVFKYALANLGYVTAVYEDKGYVIPVGNIAGIEL